MTWSWQTVSFAHFQTQKVTNASPSCALNLYTPLIFLSPFLIRPMLLLILCENENADVLIFLCVAHPG